MEIADELPVVTERNYVHLDLPPLPGQLSLVVQWSPQSQFVQFKHIISK